MEELPYAYAPMRSCRRCQHNTNNRKCVECTLGPNFRSENPQVTVSRLYDEVLLRSLDAYRTITLPEYWTIVSATPYYYRGVFDSAVQFIGEGTDEWSYAIHPENFGRCTVDLMKRVTAPPNQMNLHVISDCGNFEIFPLNQDIQYLPGRDNSHNLQNYPTNFGGQQMPSQQPAYGQWQPPVMFSPQQPYQQQSLPSMGYQQQQPVRYTNMALQVPPGALPPEHIAHLQQSLPSGSYQYDPETKTITPCPWPAGTAPKEPQQRQANPLLANLPPLTRKPPVNQQPPLELLRVQAASVSEPVFESEPNSGASYSSNTSNASGKARQKITYNLPNVGKTPDNSFVEGDIMPGKLNAAVKFQRKKTPNWNVRATRGEPVKYQPDASVLLMPERQTHPQYIRRDIDVIRRDLDQYVDRVVSVIGTVNADQRAEIGKAITDTLDLLHTIGYDLRIRNSINMYKIDLFRQMEIRRYETLRRYGLRSALDIFQLKEKLIEITVVDWELISQFKILFTEEPEEFLLQFILPDTDPAKFWFFCRAACAMQRKIAPMKITWDTIAIGWGLKKYILVILSALMGNCHAHHYARTYRQAEQNRRLKSYVNRMGEPLNEEQQAKVLNDLLHVMQVDGLKTESIHKGHYDGIYDLIKRFAERQNQGKRKVALNSPDTPSTSKTVQPGLKKPIVSIDTVRSEETPKTANAVPVVSDSTVKTVPATDTVIAVPAVVTANTPASTSGTPQNEVTTSVELLTIQETPEITEQKAAMETDEKPSLENNFLFPSRQALREKQRELIAADNPDRTLLELDICVVTIPDNDDEPLYFLIPAAEVDVDMCEDSGEAKATSAVLSDALNVLNAEPQVQKP
ncbi:uncharacterized protein LOC129584448 isoform X2 [Paramacrobiotus metropolitanus]|nr:uncharacterized protein LOC129584448 isoform X2 [Paramacrobiotus metropolitanus]